MGVGNCSADVEMTDQSNQPIILPKPQEMVELTPENEIPFYKMEDFPALLDDQNRKKCHIGNGIFGDCYKVFHYLTGDVVYKEPNYHDELKRNQEFDRSYQLNHHPFIVAFFGYVYKDKKENITGILLEYMANGDLFRYILRPSNASLSPEVLNTYAKQISIALNFMHNRGIIHRDLKPNNILVSGDGKIVKISDLGYSRKIDECYGVSLSALVGTFQYSAPEQLEGKNYTNKVDIFSFAMIVYFLYFKKHPYSHLDWEDLQEMEIEEKIERYKTYVVDEEKRPSLSELDSKGQGAIKNLIERCWKSDPNERPTAQEIAEQFIENPEIPTFNWDWKNEGVLDSRRRLPPLNNSPNEENHNMITVKECVPRYERPTFYIKKLGTGLYGNCYHTFHYLLGEFAYKEEEILPSKDPFKVGNHTVSRNEFRLREFDNCFRLNHHPNIVPLYGYFFQADSSHTNIIGHGMEYMANGTLFDYVPKLHEKKGLNPSEDDLDKFERHLNTFTKQIASALAFMHHRSIVHRDLKPANILISHDEYIAKIADFGLSKKLMQTSSGPITTCLGDYQFTAPEQLNDSGKYSYPVDCYSFGMILFYMFYNELPFPEAWRKIGSLKIAEKIKKSMTDSSCSIPIKKINEKEKEGIEKSTNQRHIDKMIKRSIQIAPKDRPSLAENAKHVHKFFPSYEQLMTDALACMCPRCKIRIVKGFTTKITALLAGSDSVSGADVLSEAFVFCRNCNQSSIDPISLFTSEEREKTEQQIIEAIPLLDRDIRTRVNTLGQESATRIRSIRSGLEFIRDNFGPKNAYLEYELEKLMFDAQVKRLDQNLNRWKGERGQYDFGNDPVDLRGVPESHSWWSKQERDDSIMVFGTK